MKLNIIDKEIENLISKHGIPGRDLYTLPSSKTRFPDGAHYRNEISGINSVKDMEECSISSV